MYLRLVAVGLMMLLLSGCWGTVILIKSSIFTRSELIMIIANSSCTYSSSTSADWQKQSMAEEGRSQPWPLVGQQEKHPK